jgi:hypothetical protein
MRVEHYIAELLYRYNCVVVPDFGAFLAQTQSARINAATNVIYPPSKSISFNEQVSSNDGLLISHIAEAENSDYEAILQLVIETSKEWKVNLNNGKRLKLDTIGELWTNTEGAICFQPFEKVNFLTSSFGLSSFISSPIARETLKEEIVAMEERIPITFTPEKREAVSSGSYLKYAAIFLLAVSTTIAGYQFVNQGLQKHRLAEENATEEVSKHIQEATFFDITPLELSTLSLKVLDEKEVKKVGGSTPRRERLHHIVAGAFRFKRNADKKIRQLKRRGFEPSYIGTNPHGLHLVAYASHTDPSTALKVLKKIKRTQSIDAWLLSTK